MNPIYHTELTVGDWVLYAEEDGDSRLTVIIRHNTGQQPEELEFELGQEGEWTQRFSTPGIEQYRRENW